MSKSKKVEHWQPTDHACRECGGRVVMVTNSGPTAGGNPVYRCADCGLGAAGMDPHHICWCGFTHRGQVSGGDYLCINVERAKSEPAIQLALMRAGYLAENPRYRPKVEIAVVSESQLRWAASQLEGKAP